MNNLSLCDIQSELPWGQATTAARSLGIQENYIVVIGGGTIRKVKNQRGRVQFVRNLVKTKLSPIIAPGNAVSTSPSVMSESGYPSRSISEAGASIDIIHKMTTTKRQYRSTLLF